jgi:predicted nucleotidyltransferase
MRLTPQELQAIKTVVGRRDPAARIYLFGSRTDDSRRGGDIDLLILSSILSDCDRRPLRVELFEQLGEQKIDLLIAKNLSRPFIRIAYSQGVLL